MFDVHIVSSKFLLNLHNSVKLHIQVRSSEFRTAFTNFLFNIVLFLYILRYKGLDNPAAFNSKTKTETFDMEAEKCNQ